MRCQSSVHFSGGGGEKKRPGNEDVIVFQPLLKHSIQRITLTYKLKQVRRCSLNTACAIRCYVHNFGGDGFRSGPHIKCFIKSNVMKIYLVNRYMALPWPSYGLWPYIVEWRSDYIFTSKAFDWTASPSFLCQRFTPWCLYTQCGKCTVKSRLTSKSRCHSKLFLGNYCEPNS